MCNRVRAALALTLLSGLVYGSAWAEPYTDYILHCQGCHGANGEGSAGGAPPFRGHVARLAATRMGREYLLRVPGVQFSELDDARLAAVLNWILDRFEESADRGSEVRPFSAEEVARLRGRPLLSVAEERARVLAGSSSAK